MTQTFAYYATVFYRRFAAYTGARLQELGLNFGALFLILYVGKHPGCSQAELTAALGLDWGYSQYFEIAAGNLKPFLAMTLFTKILCKHFPDVMSAPVKRLSSKL